MDGYQCSHRKGQTKTVLGLKNWNFLRKPYNGEKLAYAVMHGDVETAKEYLHAGVSPNAYSLTGGLLLHVAAAATQPEMIDGFANFVVAFGILDVVQACLDAGVDFNRTYEKTKESVAHYLALHIPTELFDLLAPHLTFETMTKVSAARRTPLQVALGRGECIAMKLIEAGADINPLDKSIDTALLVAIKKHCFKAARLILERHQRFPGKPYRRV
ncbi:hypothetical protein PENVUL_c001G05096 [Penicillium vulpinum]|uniref:Uncharacterized protein n=1 Tax=Penicillium vulpinum TaxID=29845 RepID=A0A1V6SF08_9EURO|nr:hypothetical protein PENVUL_c001G05096 [Penicillium vulpinum]